MTEPEQPVVAQPLGAALEKLRGFPTVRLPRPGMDWHPDQFGYFLQWHEVEAALAVEAVRPETDIDEQRHHWAEWIARDEKFPRDAACAECVPGGPILVAGFQCVPHSARAFLRGERP